MERSDDPSASAASGRGADARDGCAPAAEALRLAETLNRINEILATALTRKQVLARLVGEASEAAGADMCLVIECVGDMYTVTHVRNVKEDLLGTPKSGTFYPAFAAAAAQRRPVLIADTWSDPRTNKDFVVPHELRAFILLPLQVDESVFGVLALAYGNPRSFGDEDAEFAERLSLAMSMALTNASRYESEVAAKQQAREELERTLLLQDVAMASASGDDLVLVASRILGDVVARLGACMGDVRSLNPATGQLELLASHGYSDAIIARTRRLVVDDSGYLTVRAWEEDRLLTHEDEDLTPERRAVIARAGIEDHSYFVTPILHGETKLGTFGLTFEGQRSFTQAELDLFGAIAHVLGQAIRNMQLHSAEIEAVEALRDSAQQVRRKLDAILSPEGDVGELDLEDVIDAPGLQSMLDDFYSLARFPVGIIDLKGKVLVGAGWQDICTRFHRMNPETCEQCIESDTQLSSGVSAGESKLYKCKNGMWDVATPVIVGGRHIGNVFSGQFFFDDEHVDRESFAAQAKRYGFDEDAYLAALDAVPRFSRADVDAGMSFYMKLTHTISQLSFSTIQLARALAERDILTASLRRSNDRTLRHAAVLEGISTVLRAALTTESDEELGHACVAVAAHVTESGFGFIGEVGANGQLHELAMDRVDPGPGSASERDRSAGPVGDLVLPGLYSRVIDEAVSVIVNAPVEDPGDVRLPEGHPPLTAFLGVPLVTERGAIGMVAVADRDGGYGDEQRESLEALAPVIVEAFQRRRAERALRESREDLAHAQEVAHVGSWRLDAGTGELRWSDETYRIFGIAEGASLTYKAFLAAIHPDDRALVDLKWTAAMGGEPYDIEHRLVVDGAVKWVREQAVLESSDEGAVLGGFGITQDITGRKQAEAERELHLSRLFRLLAASTDVLAAPDVSEMSQRVCDSARELIGAKYATLGHGYADGIFSSNVVSIAPGNPVCPDSLAFIVERGGTHLELMDEAGSLRLTDAEMRSHPRWWGLPDGHAPLRGLLGASVTDGAGKAVGMILLSDREHGDFTEEDELLLRQLASIASLGLENARLLEAEQRQAELQRVLAEVAAALASSLEVERTMPAVLAAASRVLHADGGLLSVRERGGWRTSTEYGIPREQADDACAGALASTLARVLATRDPFVVVDVSADEQDEHATAGCFGRDSFAAYPVLLRDQVAAALVFSFGKGRRLSEDERGFLARLAFTIGVTGENARLYERERRIAHTLQEAILTPPEEIVGLETSHVYRPASSEANVGGDYYDVFALDDRHVGIVVGDVSGKGIDAARLTSLLRDGIRAYAFESHDPAAVLARLNTLVHHSVSAGLFSTVFFGVLEVPTGRLRYCVAGHPPPVIVRADGTVSLLQTRSPVLGAFEGLEFKLSDDAELALGDVLVLYTDGVTEARRDGDLFGEQRLLVALAQLNGTPVSDMSQALLGEVLDFTGGHLGDDTIILCVARRPEGVV